MTDPQERGEVRAHDTDGQDRRGEEKEAEAAERQGKDRADDAADAGQADTGHDPGST